MGTPISPSKIRQSHSILPASHPIRFVLIQSSEDTILPGVEKYPPHSYLSTHSPSQTQSEENFLLRRKLSSSYFSLSKHTRHLRVLLVTPFLTTLSVSYLTLLGSSIISLVSPYGDFWPYPTLPQIISSQWFPRGKPKRRLRIIKNLLRS